MSEGAANKDEELLRAKVALEERSRQLADSVSLLNATLESSPDGIIAMDLSRRVINHNSRFAAIWDLPTRILEHGDGAAIDRHIENLVKDAELFQLCVREQARYPETAICDEFELRDGRAFERYATPQMIDARCAGVVVTWREITERRRAEAARLELELRMREGQKMESLGTLAGGIAHDFNNILGAVLGNAMLAREDLGPDSPALVGLGEIERAGHRGRQLVQRILSFSRQQPQAFKAQALRPIIEEAIALMRATLPVSAELRSTFAQKPIHVSGDATQISQVVMNLCTNAWQALEKRPGHIDIILDTRSADAATHARSSSFAVSQFARLRISDNGSGMDAATQARIFEPFFTTKQVGQGTGLGLSVVHGIVAAHGGSIAVQSTPGRGTTFEVLLPLVEAPPEAPTAATPSSRTVVQSRHVVYIDDDESMVFLITRLLRRRGHRVSGYEDARLALEALRANPADFDLVVSDFSMPQLSGLDVARQVAEIRPGLPVIIATGYVNDELQSAAREIGVRHLLEKASTAEELCETIEQLLDAPAAAGAAP